MNYNIQTVDRKYRVSVTRNETGYCVVIDGESIQVDDAVLRNSFKVHLIEKNLQNYLFSVHGSFHRIEISDPRDYSLSSSNKQAKLDRLLAPIPGRIVKISAKVGDTFQAGDSLLVLEAMKMENELKAAHACTVSKIHVVEGQIVEHGFVLLEFEQEAP